MTSYNPCVAVYMSACVGLYSKVCVRVAWALCCVCRNQPQAKRQRTSNLAAETTAAF